MKSAYKEIPLGSEAVKYIHSCLGSGKTLSSLVLETCDLDNGKVATYLPTDIDLATITQFDVGGKLGETAVWKKLGSQTDVWLASQIRSFLSDENKRIIVFENALARPNDPWLARRQSQIFTFKEEVYHFLLRKDAEKRKIRKAIRDATSHLFIGIMSSVLSDACLPQQRQVLTADELRGFAERTESIVVGAYDYEGYVIWSGNGKGAPGTW